MNKTIITMVAIIVILTAIITGMSIYKKQQYAYENTTNQENVEIGEVAADEEIYDDCTDEWENIKQIQENETLQVNSNYEKENKNKYILKQYEGVIAVYKINENEEEELYDITDIAITYLPQEDQEILKNGITVEGEENLNQLLEDFE